MMFPGVTAVFGGCPGWKWQPKREPARQPKREFWQSEREPLGAIKFSFLTID